jgi:hypothetical protein
MLEYLDVTRPVICLCAAIAEGFRSRRGPQPDGATRVVGEHVHAELAHFAILRPRCTPHELWRGLWRSRPRRASFLGSGFR